MTTTRGWIGTCLLLGVLGLTPAHVACASDGDAEALRQASETTLTDLASQGRFTEVLQALREVPRGVDDAEVQPLIRELERFEANAQQRDTQRAEALDRATAQLTKRMEAGELYEALASAIEAHSLAAEPAVLLESPAVTDLVAKTEIKAKEAELGEDWVEAAALYSRLNLLFEDSAKYREDLKRIGRHVRLLHLYAPDALQKLQEARAERLGEDAPEAPERAEDETWQARLNKVDASILHTAIETAAARHIDHSGFGPMIVGGIDPLLTLLATPALAETFPALSEAEKVAAMREDLVKMRAEVLDIGEIERFVAMSYLDRIVAINGRTVNLPESVVAYEVTEGALSTLDDFSSMYWPEDVDFLSRSTEGSFSGIGVQISRRNEQLTVVSPLNGTPAQEAGIKAGDVIANVNGKDTASWSLNKAVREITGPRGTHVDLTVERIGRDEPLQYTLTRDTIEIESVKGWTHDAAGDWDYWLDKEAGIGYVRLTQFIPQSEDKIDAAIQELREQGELNSLVLDLRHNPGGLLNSAIQIVNRFLDEGPILFTVDGQRNVKSFWEARKRGTYPDLDLVVLINQGSASASEIVSGALQDRDRAFVVGSRSYGKGSVQDVYWYPSYRNKEWGLKVTTHYYQLPGGRIIHRTPDATLWGVDPDLAVKVSDQTTAWGLELRQEIDVLRDGKDGGADGDVIELGKSNPAVRLAGVEPVEPTDDAAAERVKVPGVTADTLLELGLDPQLEAALLLLKTRAVAENVAVAEK